MTSGFKGTALTRRGFLGISATTAAATLLAACSGNSGSSGSGTKVSSSDLDAALTKGGSITYWTWTPSAKAQAAAFMKAYPKVKVTVVNAGTATDEYTKLQNAISAGKGAPDVAQVEYYALQQFALSGGLSDLKQFGFDSLKSKYTESTWNQVSIAGGIYGLPQDSGPMILMYNKTTFDKYGISVPTTWKEYISAAKKLHTADPTKYITSDAGDPGFADPLIWQAGGRPYKTSGENVTIDLQDKGSKLWADTWNQLLEPGLLSPIPTWSNDWYKGLSNGTIASIITGAWMPGILESSVPTGKGQWRVAALPSYDGSPSAAENGGSSQAVVKQSKNQALAAAFLRWLNSSDASIEVFLKSGGFPSTMTQLNADSFINAAPDYFGGQKVNQVCVAASKAVTSGWQYLPFQVYANSVFPDTVGTAYTGKSDLNAGLKLWQTKLVSYGNQQGFSVNK